MVTTAPQDKKVLGYHRECSSNTDKCCYINYCLVVIVQYDMQLNRSTYEVLQILSISLMDKIPLQQLFNKTNFNDVKEQFNPLIPRLFD